MSIPKIKPMKINSLNNNYSKHFSRVSFAGLNTDILMEREAG